MAVYKRGKIWWYEFLFDGERVRKSTKQGNKRVAEQMEAADRTRRAKGEVGIVERKFAPTLKAFAPRFVITSYSIHYTKLYERSSVRCSAPVRGCVRRPRSWTALANVRDRSASRSRRSRIPCRRRMLSSPSAFASRSRRVRW